jgi:hypothetical protein
MDSMMHPQQPQHALKRTANDEREPEKSSRTLSSQVGTIPNQDRLLSFSANSIEN